MTHRSKLSADETVLYNVESLMSEVLTEARRRDYKTNTCGNTRELGRDARIERLAGLASAYAQLSDARLNLIKHKDSTN